MFVVDTNVLVYAANRDCPEHERCRELVEQWRHGTTPWYTTWAILYEFLRVVTHARVLPRPLAANSALDFVEAVLAAPAHRILVASEQHAVLARQLAGEVPALAGNLFHDFHTAVLMREHGVGTIYTRDADFRRFTFLEVIDPLS
ncbi:MAG TPA: TA system VapC family ribonuclease toxin [Longimicrobiales bacterium]|nr:TA system VapC family ribonuclease toxin [Longimicrobiales bacterium]